MERLESSEKIFEYLKPSENVKLTELNNSDRLNILAEMKNYYLELRCMLGLSPDITFGLEMEFENAERSIIEEELLKVLPSGEWKVVDDGSLLNGGEIRSPKLIDDNKTWIDLREVCEIVDRNAYVMENVGSHIHIGMHILGNNSKYWANFAKLWLAYENVIFRFLYGEYISYRSGMYDQARPIAIDLINKMGRIDKVSSGISASHVIKILDSGMDKIDRRKRCVNLTNIESFQPYQYNQKLNKNTIEFRSPNGTFDPVIWQNNVNLLVHLLMYAKSDKFDDELINERMYLMNVSGNAGSLNKYAYIYREQAIELADLIFDNNLDKVYFLRQYYKDGNVSNKAMVKSSEFTRRRCK